MKRQEEKREWGGNEGLTRGKNNRANPAMRYNKRQPTDGEIALSTPYLLEDPETICSVNTAM